jgi:hypothetical protein
LRVPDLHPNVKALNWHRHGSICTSPANSAICQCPTASDPKRFRRMERAGKPRHRWANPRGRESGERKSQLGEGGLEVFDDLKLVRCPRSLDPTLVTLPSMSLIPFAPFSFPRFRFQQAKC